VTTAHPALRRSTLSSSSAGASLIAALTATLCACGAAVPTRYVVERDVAGLSYRRYQRVLDIEVPVEGNAAVGHTATYVKRGRGRSVSVATAFVTVYTRAASLSAEVGERLRDLGAYEITVVERAGDYMWRLEGAEDGWLVWVSGRHMVKLGGPPGEMPPEELIETYVDLYPSDLGENGKARSGTASAGFSRQTEIERRGEEMPDHLREGTPR